MKQIKNFIIFKFNIQDKNFKLLYLGLFGTTLMTYLTVIFPFLPESIGGFNWSGLAWMTALVITLKVVSKTTKSAFPMFIWLPWIFYLMLTLLVNFSTLGLQLTAQYFLPILMGFAAGSFVYNLSKILWVLQGLLKTTLLIYIVFIIYQIVYGFCPNMAATPMFFIILSCICLGLFFFTKKLKFLMIYGMLFLMPFLNVTRMALLVFGTIFIFHFANKGIQSKIRGVVVGGILMLFVVNSRGFQEKTFFSGSGQLSELNTNYYDSDNFNTNGRKTWKVALEPGLKNAPIFGNGPRADAKKIGEAMDKETGEAHNDYMSVRYNYGYVGLGLLLFGFLVSFSKLYQMSLNNKDKVFQLLVLSNLTLFIGFLLFMYSDNILKYTVWFPNYFFVLMGICFSVYKKGFRYE